MRPRLELLISVPFVVSVLVLVLNDHVLKSMWPGLVTGKLSDFAGVAMVAVLLTALSGRRSVGFGAAVVGFTALKTIAAVAAAVAPVLGGTTRTDPSDLVAIAMLLPLWRWVGHQPVRLSGRDSAWLLPLHVVAVTAAVFATTATSCADEGVHRLAAIDGVAYASTTGGVFESADGGVTWTRSAMRPGDDRLGRPLPDDQVSCVDSGSCFTIVRPRSGTPVVTSVAEPAGGPSTPTAPTETVTPHAVVVAETVGGASTPILTVSSSASQELARLKQFSCGDGTFWSIAAVEKADGTHVMVSMGEAGMLHYGPESTWEWVAVGDYGLEPDQAAAEPFGIGASSTVPGDRWEGWPNSVATIFLVLAPLAVALAILPIARLAGRRGRSAAGPIAVCVAVALLLGLLGYVVYAITEGFGNPRGRAIAGAFIAAVAIATIGTVFAWVGRPRRVAGWDPPQASRRAG